MNVIEMRPAASGDPESPIAAGTDKDDGGAVGETAKLCALGLMRVRR